MFLQHNKLVNGLNFHESSASQGQHPALFYSQREYLFTTIYHIKGNDVQLRLGGLKLKLRGAWKDASKCGGGANGTVWKDPRFLKTNPLFIARRDRLPFFLRFRTVGLKSGLMLWESRRRATAKWNLGLRRNHKIGLRCYFKGSCYRNNDKKVAAATTTFVGGSDGYDDLSNCISGFMENAVMTVLVKNLNVGWFKKSLEVDCIE